MSSSATLELTPFDYKRMHMHAASNARTCAVLLSFLPLPLIMMCGGRHDVDDDDALDEAGRERCGGGRESTPWASGRWRGCAMLIFLTECRFTNVVGRCFSNFLWPVGMISLGRRTGESETRRQLLYSNFASTTASGMHHLTVILFYFQNSLPLFGGVERSKAFVFQNRKNAPNLTTHNRFLVLILRGERKVQLLSIDQ